MYLYIDESGSINNKISSYSPFFIIALIHVKDKPKLQRAYKRFVASNLSRLKELDKDKLDKRGNIAKVGGKMFDGDKFRELKGVQFDPDMKRKFIKFFSQKPHFDIYYIKINNAKLTDNFCSNTARCFNYTLRLAINYFIANGILPNEECILQLDERNEKTGTKFFLENYLNTELTYSGSCNGPFQVKYFDSADNRLIQIADVFANFYYSHLISGAYQAEFDMLEKEGIIKCIFDFPL